MPPIKIFEVQFWGCYLVFCFTILSSEIGF